MHRFRIIAVMAAVLAAFLVPAFARAQARTETIDLDKGRTWTVNQDTGQVTVTEPPAVTPKVSVLFATGSPDWKLTPTLSYEITVLKGLFGSGTDAYILGLGGVDATNGSPTGGFGVVVKPRIAKNAWLSIGAKAMLDSQGKAVVGALVGIEFEVLKF